MEVSLWVVCGWRPLDMRVCQCTYLREDEFSSQSFQFSDHPDQWVTCLPGEQGLHFDTKPYSFGTTQTITSY
jgi:hypothetical protein